MSLIPKYKLPVLYGALNKAGFWKWIGSMAREMTIEAHPTVAHETAFLWCATNVEQWFLRHAPYERGLCIADDTKQRELLKTNFRDYRKHPQILESVRFQHLIDTIYFGDSRESIFLQLADVCAFVIRRTLMKKNDVADFYNIIEKQVQPKPLKDKFNFPVMGLG